MPLPSGFFIADAHEDLAYHCQEYSRGLVDPGDTPCMITLPWLQAVGVRLVCATLFTPHHSMRAQRRARIEEQWRMYEQWFELYPDALKLIRGKAELDTLAAAPGPIGVIMLMEGCELLDGPAELELWHRRGLRMASLTWNGVNQYASGTFGDRTGITPAGRELLTAMHGLGMVLDLSHLADAGCADAFALWDGPICATHSNARTLCDSERNLTDATVLEISRRGGIVGLNLLASFIRTGWKDGDELPTVAAALDHVDHIAGLAGRGQVGLGTDLDGGLTPLNTPAGIDRIGDVTLLLDGLRGRGWDAEAIAGFAGANWWRFFAASLPEA